MIEVKLKMSKEFFDELKSAVMCRGMVGGGFHGLADEFLSKFVKLVDDGGEVIAFRKRQVKE